MVPGRWAAGLLLWLGMASAAVSVSAEPDRTLPDFETVRSSFRSSETLLLDRHGEVLHRLRTDFQVRRGAWVALGDTSPALRMALLLSEDRRFHEHSGVDWWAVSAAAWGNLWHERTRGASTLTMQLAGLLDPALQRPASTARGLSQKWAQASAARELETRWRKDQILEAYLNLVPFRGEIVGIDALSHTLFGKSPHALNAPESALAAALIRAPNAPASRVAERACRLLQQMQDPKADCLSVDVLAGMTLHRRDWAPSEGVAPHLAQRLIRQVTGLREGNEDLSVGAAGRNGKTLVGDGPERRSKIFIEDGDRRNSTALSDSVTGEDIVTGFHDGHPTVRSTLDGSLQRLAIDTLRTQLRELQGRHVEDGAVVVLDNVSGDVLAWVGSSGSLSRAAQVDGVMARRQPGSALKPFLYAQALAEHRLTAASLLDDSPAQLPTASGLYMPQNYDHRYQGWVSVRTALGSSLNIPAVRTLVMVSPDAFHRQLQRLGMRFPEGSGYYGYSLALGSAEVSLLQLTNAYRALANGGQWCPVHLLPEAHRRGAPSSLTGPVEHADGLAAIARTPASSSFHEVSIRTDDEERQWPPEDCHQALDAGAAFIIGDILSDRHARLPTFGLDSVLDTRFWSAVKTGTSKDMRDNWAVGYSQRYTVGVWVGNASGAPMHDVSGTSGAAPAWATLMRELHRHEASRPPSPPAGVVRQQVDFGGFSKTMPETAGPDEHGVQALPEGRSGKADDAGAHATERPGIEAPRQEWFLAGTEQRHFSPPATVSASNDTRTGKGDGAHAGRQDPDPSALPARIVAPAPNTIIALDPDIPPANQQLRLEASHGTSTELRWFIDEQPVGQGARVGWMPLPGRHTITLRDARGGVLDVRRIEVRGAWLRPALQ